MTRSMRIGEFLKESRIPGTSGDTARKITVKLYGKGVFAKQENRPGSENTSYYKRKTGQFIYSKLDFLNGAFGIVPDDLDGYESTVDLPCFDFTSIEIHPDWFLYFVSRRDFYSYQGGLGNGGRKARRISPDDFLELEIDVPPLPEQKKITEILSGIDRLILAIQNKVEKLKTAQDGLANSWDEHVHLEPVEGSLGDLIASIDSGWSPACEDVPPKAGEWGVLKVSAVTKGYFCQKESKRLPSDLEARDQLLVRKGDLLITRANGNLGLVGRGVIVNENPTSKLLMSDKILRLNPELNASQNFLLMLLNSRNVRRQIESAVGGSTGAKNIGQGLLRQIQVSIPTSEDQAKIGNLSSSIYAALAASKRRLDYLISLKKGLSAALLSGRKRVTV
jgi:type I restriction enzyme S subunit